MAVATPANFNYLYAFDTGAKVHRYTDQSLEQEAGSEQWLIAPGISHTMPTFSGDAKDAEIDVTMRHDNALANLYLVQPPPYPVRLTIYEYDRDAEELSDHWAGYLIRPNWDFNNGKVYLKCKTSFFKLDRESVTDSLSALSRYSVFDPRSGVNVEAFKVSITVTALNELRDILTVTGISEPDGWHRGGVIVAPDGDELTIIDNTTESGNKKLYLAGAFLSTTLDEGDLADIYGGDDLTFEAWDVKFSAGPAFGGWPFTPNADPAKTGLR